MNGHAELWRLFPPPAELWRLLRPISFLPLLGWDRMDRTNAEFVPIARMRKNFEGFPALGQG